MWRLLGVQAALQSDGKPLLNLLIMLFDRVRTGVVAARVMVSHVPVTQGELPPPADELSARMVFGYPLQLNTYLSNRRTLVVALRCPIRKASTHLVKISKTTRIIVLSVFVFGYGPINSKDTLCYGASGRLAFSGAGRRATPFVVAAQTPHRLAYCFTQLLEEIPLLDGSVDLFSSGMANFDVECSQES